jgi:hypothetical protein
MGCRHERFDANFAASAPPAPVKIAATRRLIVSM